MMISTIYEKHHKLLNEHRNLLLGYRTPRALKNEQNWCVAQNEFIKYSKLFNRYFIYVGTIWLIIDLIVKLKAMSMILQFVSLILLILLIIIFTEKNIKAFEESQKT
ncbi:hypothetical protein BU057_13945 [Staphylococcus succinus]|uniref:Uncharacterized protein n=2 Tax=Staphylococcus succinus TaxID=61015 RepID=A0ABX5IIR5_9STAP|nr:hypothetical protein BU057_13945 [Staphylococcus succinus]